MNTLIKVINLVRKGDWGISEDLQDEYFHIQIFHIYRKYLSFLHSGQEISVSVLAFGPKTVPQAFTKVVSVVAANL